MAKAAAGSGGTAGGGLTGGVSGLSGINGFASNLASSQTSSAPIASTGVFVFEEDLQAFRDELGGSADNPAVEGEQISLVLDSHEMPEEAPVTPAGVEGADGMPLDLVEAFAGVFSSGDAESPAAQAAEASVEAAQDQTPLAEQSQKPEGAQGPQGVSEQLDPMSIIASWLGGDKGNQKAPEARAGKKSTAPAEDVAEAGKALAEEGPGKRRSIEASFTQAAGATRIPVERPVAAAAVVATLDEVMPRSAYALQQDAPAAAPPAEDFEIDDPEAAENFNPAVTGSQMDATARGELARWKISQAAKRRSGVIASDGTMSEGGGDDAKDPEREESQWDMLESRMNYALDQFTSSIFDYEDPNAWTWYDGLIDLANSYYEEAVEAEGMDNFITAEGEIVDPRIQEIADTRLEVATSSEPPTPEQMAILAQGEAFNAAAAKVGAEGRAEAAKIDCAPGGKPVANVELMQKTDACTGSSLEALAASVGAPVPTAANNNSPAAPAAVIVRSAAAELEGGEPSGLSREFAQAAQGVAPDVAAPAPEPARPASVRDNIPAPSLNAGMM